VLTTLLPKPILSSVPLPQVPLVRASGLDLACLVIPSTAALLGVEVADVEDVTVAAIVTVRRKQIALQVPRASRQRVKENQEKEKRTAARRITAMAVTADADLMGAEVEEDGDIDTTLLLLHSADLVVEDHGEIITVPPLLHSVVLVEWERLILDLSSKH